AFEGERPAGLFGSGNLRLELPPIGFQLASDSAWRHAAGQTAGDIIDVATQCFCLLAPPHSTNAGAIAAVARRDRRRTPPAHRRSRTARSSESSAGTLRSTS